MAEEKKRGGGPKTTEGWALSSRNATQYGFPATKVLLLPDESQEEYDEMVAGWRKQFQPADYQEEKLVETLILNDWLHRRAFGWLRAAIARDRHDQQDRAPARPSDVSDVTITADPNR